MYISTTQILYATQNNNGNVSSSAEMLLFKFSTDGEYHNHQSK